MSEDSAGYEKRISRGETYELDGDEVRVLGTLRAREQGGDIWLVCYEKNPQYCHRRLLAQEMTRGRDTNPVHHPEPDDAQEASEQVADSRLDQFQDGGGLA